MSTVSAAIHARFIVPSTTRTAKIAQQQPKQKPPCAAPIRSAPSGLRMPDPKRMKNPSGERQWWRQTALSGVTCHSAAARNVAPARRATHGRPSASGSSSALHARYAGTATADQTAR